MIGGVDQTSCVEIHSDSIRRAANGSLVKAYGDTSLKQRANARRRGSQRGIVCVPVVALPDAFEETAAVVSSKWCTDILAHDLIATFNLVIDVAVGWYIACLEIVIWTERGEGGRSGSCYSSGASSSGCSAC